MTFTTSFTCLLVGILALGFFCWAEDELHFPELRLKSGPTYKNCTVTRTDPEGFLIRHEGGMARISFFDVEEEILKNFQFDPVEALKVYEMEQEKQRRLRKQAVFEVEKQKAKVAIEREQEALEKIARKTWTPIIGKVAHEIESGIFVHAKEVKFVPTTELSTLGFERPGPPKRILKPFSKDLIFLPIPRSQNEKNPEWHGYIKPHSIKRVAHPRFPEKTVPVHLAVPRR
jgi:hypothetical protein